MYFDNVTGPVCMTSANDYAIRSILGQRLVQY